MSGLAYLCGMNAGELKIASGQGKKLYIETYGCQMNSGDSEIVAAIMKAEGFAVATDPAEADVILINTCSVRDNAEQRIWARLADLKKLKEKNKGLLIGVIGCMAERLKDSLLEKQQAVDIVAGPDSYREMPGLVRSASSGVRSVNVLLSTEETYAEISPVRLDKNGVSAFISIMRGCNNMCSYCVVPFTRGRERSRDPRTIVGEAAALFDKGYREITLLGQNVNSYKWSAGGVDTMDFPDLIAEMAAINPLLRVRFATSHPKDLSDKLIEVIAANPNVCRSIHLPAQSGSNEMLAKMNRKYTREWYLDRVRAIRSSIPDCSITTDLIAGFCGETEQDHLDTLSLMETVGYDFAFMFKYSVRPETRAAKTMTDDVPEEVKTRRLNEIIALQNQLSLKSNRRDVGKTFRVLVEGESRKSSDQLFGRTSQNKVVVFDRAGFVPGDYVDVIVRECTSATLKGEIV